MQEAPVLEGYQLPLTYKNYVLGSNSLERKSSLSEQPITTTTELEAETDASKTDIRHSQDKHLINEAEITIEPVDVKSPVKKHGRHSSMDLAANGNTSITQLLEKCVSPDTADEKEAGDSSEDVQETEKDGIETIEPVAPEGPVEDSGEKPGEYVNHRGIRFTPQDDANLQPYGLVCVRELFRFLISLCNPLDSQNTSGMVHLGLSLVGTALEVSADQLAKYPSLLYLVKDPLCRNLLSVQVGLVTARESFNVDTSHLRATQQLSGRRLASPGRPGPPIRPLGRQTVTLHAMWVLDFITREDGSNVGIRFVLAFSWYLANTRKWPGQSLVERNNNECRPDEASILQGRLSSCPVDGSRVQVFLDPRYVYWLQALTGPYNLNDSKHSNYRDSLNAIPTSTIKTRPTKKIKQLPGRRLASPGRPGPPIRLLDRQTVTLHALRGEWNSLLLSTERISIFALDLQVSFLLFEALRTHLKFQMEAFYKKIIEIISADTTKAIYELKEIHHLALESLAQMFRIPGLCAEIYLNYDCDVYCMNVFEELTKLLSKNVVSSTAYNIHSLSLEALMTIIEAVEMGCSHKEVKPDPEIPPNGEEEKEKDLRSGHVSLELGGLDDVSVVSDHVTHDISQYFGCGRTGRHKPSSDLPSEAELDNIKNMKKWVTQGTELFNQKPERGIEFLQEHGVLATPLDPHEVAMFLRENPDLDKKMIGEFICKRSSRGEDEDGGPSVLGAFADSFDYAGLRIDQALRMYLETFRLPGEAPLIFLVMERFAERWHSSNGEPFANTDAAFRLAYALIMLNMDQHNHNAKKLNVPMTVEDFVKNLRGCNGSGDFDQSMLEAVFHSIKSSTLFARNEEMVMPAERTGAVRDAYLWRVLQRRGAGPQALYRAAPAQHPHHARLFTVACPPTVTALSAAFERSTPPTVEEMESNRIRDSGALLALNGLERCAALVARLPPDNITLDTLLLTLCKFTGLLAPQHANYIAIGVTLGQSSKAQLALRRACAVAARHADCIRDSWRHLLEIVKTLYIGRLLPKCLIEAEDYLAPNGTVSLIREAARGSEAGLLSSLYSYIALGESGMRTPTPHEKVLIDAAMECVAKCNFPGLLITETKFLQVESLQELIRAMVTVGTPPDSDSLQMNPQLEDITIFFLELLGQTLIQNRDRVLCVWDCAGPHMSRTISCGMYEIVKTSAQNVHSAQEWDIVFALLCAAGAGAWPNDARAASPAASSRSEGSEDESERRPTSASSESELSHSPQTQGWILVKNETESSETFELEGKVSLRAHRASALSRCSEALALVVRDVAHVTPYNCRAAVRAVRIFARATLHTGKKSGKSRSGHKSRPSSGRRRYDDSSDEEVDTLDQYHMVSIQLLDLMHTLHSRTAQIFKWWRDEADQGQNAEEYDLWEVAWKPLLQGIAQFCTDRRKQVSNSAVAYLQRALLAPGLAGMGGARWEAAFHHVLFPLLELLPRRADVTARAHTIMCKVPPSLTLQCKAWAALGSIYISNSQFSNFFKLRIILFHIFSNADGYNDLWYITWDKINEFLPNLKEELFPQVKDNAKPSSLPSHMQPSLPPSLPTLVPVQQTSTPTLVPIPSAPQPIPPQSPQIQPPMLAQNLAHSPVNLVQTPPLVANAPTLVAPTPISGMVPIRNPLYDQTGLTSSVLLQPLNEMISTPIGMSMQPQMPMLYPQNVDPTPTRPDLIRMDLRPDLTPQVPTRPENPYLDPSQPDITRADPHVINVSYNDPVLPETKVEQSELYADYLTNPYTEIKDISKEATLYDPEDPKPPPNDIKNPLLSALDKKSYSANATPMHTVSIPNYGV
ncbi:hypothetical protein HW555_002736 [Spodoptera exigua]|uniref:SEC7 domain-containing protein n=1 Tax=Spodoptera exigua TaxID=7107 RepID=A0A835GMP1_SPOEX|nr:hypothetical protein HW555_002736 [Spodoptera exigua]